ncbi:hypothetical protein RYZ26_06150 [Terasakiella sp. A23]|uniref:hypothetical protein n=1 Tax=Terasakiella sp. FCG-A23 TaxID=3080561 RepID=UPI0029549917|nr:hypothetical protein [Terasakiella sp. A23]MDV7339165.1 hypothetical protein [Terasakiella sp. A23]
MRREEYTFEVFNKDVHAHLQENGEHPEFSDFWGSRRRFTVEACSTEEARKKVDKKYPEDKGFIVTFTS